MLTVIMKTGQGEFTQTLEKGEPVLKAAWAAGLDEYGLGSCGGNCCCATCHMHVEKGLEHVSELGAMEKSLLDMQPEVNETSRLACQMRVKSEGTLMLKWMGE